MTEPRPGHFSQTPNGRERINGMRARKITTGLTIVICAFAAYSFGEYLEPFDGLLLTAILAVVSVVVIGRFVAGDGTAARGKTHQP